MLAWAGSAATLEPAHAALTTGNGTWFWRNPLPQGNNLRGVSCPGAERCLAVGGGGTILKSDDGGRSWRTVRSGTGLDLLSISCPSATPVCVVGGVPSITSPSGTLVFTEAILLTGDGGETWTSVPNLPFDEFWSMTCPTVRVCYAMGAPANSIHPPPSYLFTTADGGATWVNKGFAPVESMSCPAVALCYGPGGVGTILVTSDGWSTWTAQDPGLASGTYLRSISCPSPITCYADGEGATVLPGIPQGPSTRAVLNPAAVHVTMDGGATWVVRDTGSGQGLQAISCASLLTCVAVGNQGTVVKTTDGGTTWTGEASQSTANLVTIACSQPATCVALGGNTTLTSTFDGTNWSETGRGSQVPLHAISCPSSTVCVALGDGGTALVSKDDGISWSTHATATTNALHGVSCPSVTSCFAVGDGGVVESTADGGTSWTAGTSGTSQALRAISCPTLMGCLAVGDADAVTTTDGGATWTDTPRTAFSMNGVSCTSLTRCFEVGGGTINQATITPYSETQVASLTNTSLRAVACPSSTACFAAGWNTVVAMSGTSWVVQPVSTYYKQLLGIACSDSSTCVAVGDSGSIASTHDGTTWAVENSGTGYSLEGAACSASCLVVGDAGTVLASVAEPDPPVQVVALAGEASARVQWNESLAGALPVTGYGVTPFRNGVAQTPTAVAGMQTQATLSGLSDGARYTFTVTASNAVGTSAQSAASNAVVPGRGQYHPLPPYRILDTRIGVGAPAAPLGPGCSLDVQITGQGAVPNTGVSAVVLNVTVTNTSAPSYLTVWPAGEPRPLASNLNWTGGKTVPNLIEIAVGLDGKISIFNAAGSTDVILDVAGYVATPTVTPGPDGVYTPVVPNRVLDTRSGTGGVPRQPLGPNQSISVRVSGTTNIPTSGVAAVVLNVTVTGPSAPSYLTVYPMGGVPRPLASNLNFVPGQTVPNRVIVKVGLNPVTDTSGWVTFYNAAGTVHVIADVGGWFSDGSDAAATGSRFVGVTPVRILDTRFGIGGFSRPLGPGQVIPAMVAGHGGVPGMHDPTPPTAAVLNVTVTDTSAPSYLTVWPGQTGQPLASDLNWVGGVTVPNLVVVKLGADGTVNLYNAAGSTDVIIDVVGWYG